MVQADRRDDREVGIQQVHRIQPPAQADFHHGVIQRGLGQHLESGQCSELEIGQAGVLTGQLDAFEGIEQSRVADRHPLQLDALVVAVQMRRGIAAISMPKAAKQPANRRHRRAFAVGPGDYENRSRGSRGTHALPHGAAAFQPKIDGGRMANFKKFQPVVQRFR